MIAELLTTITTNVGVGAFLYWVIRGLKAQIDALNKTVEIQQKTLETVRTQVLETEKIGAIYRKLFEELPTEVEKWKVTILKFKDERIAELEKANQNKDEKQPNTFGIEFERMLNAMDAIEQKISTVNQIAAHSDVVTSASIGYDDHRITATEIWMIIHRATKPLTLEEIALKSQISIPLTNEALLSLIKWDKVKMITDENGMQRFTVSDSTIKMQ